VLRQVLSDTARVAVTLVPGLRRSGTGQLTVTTLQSGALIVPSMMVPFVLQGIDVPGLDASGSDILVPLPPRVSAIDMISSGILIRMEAEAN
jgi:hypothetical protein